MKQTAVEWLLNEIDMQYPEINLRRKEWMVDKAKEMEKEQIERAYHQGVVNEVSIYYTPEAEQYYNETYGDK
jgi:hypothetical protein